MPSSPRGRASLFDFDDLDDPEIEAELEARQRELVAKQIAEEEARKKS